MKNIDQPDNLFSEHLKFQGQKAPEGLDDRIMAQIETRPEQSAFNFERLFKYMLLSFGLMLTAIVLLLATVPSGYEFTYLSSGFIEWMNNSIHWLTNHIIASKNVLLSLAVCINLLMALDYHLKKRVTNMG